MTTNSKEVLLYILTQLLVNTGDTILVGQYSYYFSNMVFQQAGANVQTIPIDNHGIKVDFIKENFKLDQIKFVYVYPQHQFPTTSCLPDGRRQKLIALANTYGFIIIEDDSHHELTYAKTVNLSLVERKPQGRVIYLGTFGEFLPPGFRTNFMVAPQDFIQEAQKYLNIFGKPDVIMQQSLGEMIYEGDIHRYRRKALKIYRWRRDRFAGLLQQYFHGVLDFRVPKGGLAFWVELKRGVSLSELNEKCHERGLYIPPSCLFQNKNKTSLRLGFGHLDEREMLKVIQILKESFDSLKRKEEVRTLPKI